MGQAVIPGKVKRRYKRSPYDSGLLFYWLAVLTCIHFNRRVMSRRKVVYRRFFQFWLIFLNRNYKWHALEYNFNWCWHQTLHLKKKTFSIFEKLLKTSGTTTRVPSCLKILLTSMRVGVLACWSLRKLWEHRPQVPDLDNSSPVFLSGILLLLKVLSTLFPTVRHYSHFASFWYRLCRQEHLPTKVFPAKGGNALTRNSPIFNELCFLVKGMSAIRLAVVSLLISDFFGTFLCHLFKKTTVLWNMRLLWFISEVIT